MNSVRFVANTLLVLTALGFFLTHSSLDLPHRELLQRIFEGGLVGALADWFAVTALFRRPLGLPFPHSAIIVRKKEAIAKQFGEFVEEKFLQPEVISNRIASVNISQACVDFLNDPTKRRAVAVGITGFILSAKQFLFSPGIIGILSKTVTDALRVYPLRNFLGALEKTISTEKNFSPLMNRGLMAVGKLLEEEREAFEIRFKKSLPWFVPTFIDDKLYEMLLQGIRTWLQEVRDDESHPLREKVRQKLIVYLRSDASVALLETVKNDLLDSVEWRHFLTEIFSSFEKANKETEGQSDAVAADPLEGYITTILQDFSISLETSVSLREKFQGAANNFIVAIAKGAQGVIGALITDTLKGWDTKTLVTSIEGSIGPDLQYIRINGTVLGAFLGGILALLATLH